MTNLTSSDIFALDLFALYVALEGAEGAIEVNAALAAEDLILATREHKEFVREDDADKEGWNTPERWARRGRARAAFRTAEGKWAQARTALESWLYYRETRLPL